MKLSPPAPGAGHTVSPKGRLKPVTACILFSFRLLLYLSVAGLVLLHPGISVPYDRAGLIQWFIIIPLEALIAFLPAPRGSVWYKFALALLFLLPLSIAAGGFGPGAAPSFCAGLLSFTITWLLFHHPRWGKPAVLEPFFLAWICFGLLAFSRSSEEVSGQTLGLTPFILAWTILVFLLHSAAVYFCLHPPGVSGAGREAAFFGLGAAAVLALAAGILPADFVRNGIITNMLSDRVEETIRSNDTEWGIPRDLGGGRPRDRRTIPGNGEGRQPELRGLSEDQWPDPSGSEKEGGSRSRRRGGGGREREQYTVMVVASKQDTVYMGNSFRGGLDPEQGFLPTEDEPLNLLPSARLFKTWYAGSQVFDQGREEREVFSLSTLPQHFLPYRPVSVEPVVLSENTGPLRYIHRVRSAMYAQDPLKLALSPIRYLSAAEQSALASYLAFPLGEAGRAVLSAHLDRALSQWRNKRAELIRENPYLRDIFAKTGTGKAGAGAAPYMETILAILLSFREYQYNVNDRDDASIAGTLEFLQTTKDGDCVEFSNALALLGRLAGIPTRVVTGYLAASGLQTDAHKRGIAALRNKIEVLREFPFEDLFLVTDAHGHSWAQCYIPGYGWLDFEATAFAIPPAGLGDGNLRDVVIPLLDQTGLAVPVRRFPWRAALRAMGLLAAAALLAAYGVRYGREILLRLGAARGGRAGARSLYLLLLARLAADGKPIKPAAKTALEYARLFPPETADAPPGEASPFAAFAALYSELRWREFKEPAEAGERFLRLKREYRKSIDRTRRRGLRGLLIRLFSLRGLAYL
ncbi:MAG: transglutaminase-like domain-containing protein [Treponema sp.]|jgi:transglutaminase-like putative cysteine protease|nr:transglutaminase-like domain-containing protein [Treponema sp.]